MQDIRTRVLGQEHPDTLTGRGNVAVILQRFGAVGGGRGRAPRQYLRSARRVLGPEHPDTLISRDNLAIVLSRSGAVGGSRGEHRAVLGDRARVLGAGASGHADQPEQPCPRASGELGRLEEAEAECRAVLAVRVRASGPEHPNTLTTRDNLATVLSKRERNGHG